MCGIAGIYAYHPDADPVDRKELLRMRERMTARGPDGKGAWFSDDGRVALGHRRLSIIDLSDQADQPMSIENGRLVITYNGEIYNYRELKKELEAQGHQFFSNSDTEVILRLYMEKGESVVHDLRGMYAFAIFDAARKGLFLARDPFGIKPLYYADDGRMFRFASQVKALLTSPAVDTTPQAAGHAGFFLWGHVPEPHTLYRGIQAIPAGTSMWTDAQGKGKKQSFFSITETYANAERNPAKGTPDELKAVLRDALLDTIRHHLIADVPVGVFLSAGLDSTTIAALAKETGLEDLRTVTLAFEEYRGTANDEAPLAEQVATQIGARHQTFTISRRDFEEEREKLLDAMDQPSIDGVNSYFVSKIARESGLKVALSGLCGDELFGGYPSFHRIPKMVRWLSVFAACPGLGSLFRTSTRPVVNLFTPPLTPKHAGLLEYGGTYGGAYMLQRGLYMPWELSTLLDGDVAKTGWEDLNTLPQLNAMADALRTPHFKISALEMSWYMRNQLLRDTDWAGMAHSLELRVPFVDIHLIQTLAPWFASGKGPGKNDMAATPHNPLPHAVLKRPKTGFAIPVRDWLLGGSTAPSEHGLRGWAKYIYKRFQN
jgi:asparagine synthase (glutamine-hydrolysing)